MTTAVPAVITAPLDASIVESVLLQGDLARLTAPQRVSYYTRVCETLGLNPLTQPFAYLHLNGKTVLYAKRDATEQLRKIHGVSIVELTSREVNGVFVVTAKAQDKQQRIDVSTGAVPIATLKGEALANALMKAETKAKRRVTLSICGLGLLDETEVETIPQAATQAAVTHEAVNTETGEIVEQPALPAKSAPAPKPEPQSYTGLYQHTVTEKRGALKVWELTVDGQVFSTVNEQLAIDAKPLEGQQVSITFAPTAKGGLRLLTIEPAPVTEVTAEEIFDK